MTIFGWDASHYDDPAIGNALSQGVKFFTHKAGGDTVTGDPELDDWWTSVKGLALDTALLGAYWVPRPDLNPNAAAEAARFLAILDARCPGWETRDAFILQVDAEIWNQNAATKPSLAYLKSFCARLEVLTSGRYQPIVYASKGQYGNSLAGLGRPLWNANYPTGSTGSPASVYAAAGGDSGPGWVTYSGQVPTIWQYSSKATIGGQSTSDANAYRGTLAQLKTLVTPGWDDMDLTPAQIDDIATAVWNHMEPDPNPDATTDRRVGGDMRMMEWRRQAMQRDLQADLASLGTRLDALAEQVAALAAGLTPPSAS